MKRNPVFTPLQSGVTLIELMVSLTIGLIIMLAVMSAYLGAAGSGRTAEAIGRMNEDAQMALTILSQQLQMAGVNPSQSDRGTTTTPAFNVRGNLVPLHNPLTNAFAIRGCNLKFSDVTSVASTASLTCGHSASSAGPDSISIAYEADQYNTVATNAGVPTDCMGSGITPSTAAYTKTDAITTANATIYEAENRFYVGTSTSVVNPTLYCKGNASANAQPLIENIDNLQLSYGTSNPASTPTTVLGYLSAYEVDTEAASGFLTGLAGSATRWNAVKTVRICVVARSENPVLDTIESAKYRDCKGALITPPDKRLRRAYSTTVVLRNQ